MMREAELSVTFQPSGRIVYVLPGTRVMEAAASAGLIVDTPCGGEGLCEKCRVRIVSGTCRPTDSEIRAFSAEELQDGWRLACQSKIETSARIDIPDTSLLESRHHQILVSTDHALAEAADDPPVRKLFLELPQPKRGCDDADLLRLEKAIGPFEVDLTFIRELPQRLRQQHFSGTAVLVEHRHEERKFHFRPLIDVEPGDTRNELYAVAVDLGTTTLVAQLLNLATGKEVGVGSRMNPQTRFGDDVLARIHFARQNPDGLKRLHETIVEAVNDMIGDLCKDAGITSRSIYEISFAGNTTMQHLLVGVDPRSLGEVPFVPTIARGQFMTSAELGVHIHPRGRAYLFPIIGGFVGGDTVAGIIASEMTQNSGPTLLVDIGTNGEIVLWANGKLLAASTAAGPAFEGARISCGMRGSAGAIEKVVVDERLRFNVIGNVMPVGVCGSGLVDAAAELLRHGFLNPQGRLLATPLSPTSSTSTPESVSEDLRRRIILNEGQSAFVLATAEESGTGKPLMLTQRDFRELQLASGAIRAGITLLLQRAGLSPLDLEEVLVAGGFGNFIRRSNAQRIGLLPHEIEHRRIRYRGNTSLAGARFAAQSLQARTQAEELARKTEHIDLSLDPAFSNVFAESMLFPEC